MLRKTLLTILSLMFLASCRDVTPGLRETVEADWAKQDTAEICHYMYWPIPDPTASRDLKLLHYSTMQAELDKRGIVCSDEYPDKKMYRLQSMLEKTRG